MQQTADLIKFPKKARTFISNNISTLFSTSCPRTCCCLYLFSFTFVNFPMFPIEPHILVCFFSHRRSFSAPWGVNLRTPGPNRRSSSPACSCLCSSGPQAEPPQHPDQQPPRERHREGQHTIRGPALHGVALTSDLSGSSTSSTATAISGLAKPSSSPIYTRSTRGTCVAQTCDLHHPAHFQLHPPHLQLHPPHLQLHPPHLQLGHLHHQL